MTDLARRDVVRMLAVAPLAGVLQLTAPELERAWRYVAASRRAGRAYQPLFFTEHEYATVHVLADLIIPRDERSGGATDAGVPEFMDFLLAERESENRRTAMRGGLAWLDTECRERFGEDFLDLAATERSAVLDDIAWVDRATPPMRYGAEFFNSFRNLTASGFWSSKMGVADLRYIGNVVVPEWEGCPQEQLDRLGVRYED